MLTVIGLKLFVVEFYLFIIYIREISWRHGWLLVDTQPINKKELMWKVVNTHEHEPINKGTTRL